MPLPAMIEFLASQRDDGGQAMTRPQLFQVSSAIPPSETIIFEVTPGPGSYLTYAFRLILDPIIVPDAISVEINQYGAVPFTGTVTSGAVYRDLDFFLRITGAVPSINTIINHTSLNQQFTIYIQTLNVSSEQDWIELERRIGKYWGSGFAAVDALEKMAKTLEEVEENTRCSR